ncbi:DNA polymerase III subunit gamma/tau [Microbacterium sp. KSW2-21]|uniref:DNA polymerase III subunit gamma/tau n=1 Tax=Microbacterium algihabitans TaxID=3075992 RepID=A0ABU3RV62_9MICO|nr:DNA polymerase III subunit gamma/tau [Microbacterium sp. KSW2-21]MDU0326790.1 DNA polymerase III subunit gamma/tau [Microbacterium sp. KSW2-21]
MSTPRDDDALSWGGDDDPTLDVGEKHVPGRGSAARPAASGDSAPEALQPEPLEPEPLQPDPEPEPLQPAAAQTTPAVRHPESLVEPAPDAEEAHAGPSAPLGNVGLVGIGMIAMAFILFAVGWLLAGFRLVDLGLPVPQVTIVALTIGAGLAPLVWFVTVLVLTRSWRTWQRFLLLLLGVILLIPWPFLSLGAFL